MNRKRLLVALLALPALVATVVSLASGASAQSAGERTLSFKELEKGGTFTHIRNTKPKSPRANLEGDLIVFTNRLAAASGQVVGRLHVSCATTIGARNFMKSVLTCSGVMVLRDGTLTLQTVVSPSVSVTTGAITGGSGAYAGAQGTFVSKEAQGGSQDTISLADPT
jgi:hypothetical protein